MKVGDLVRWLGATPAGKIPNSDFGCLGVVVKYDKTSSHLVVVWVDGTIGNFNDKPKDLEVLGAK